MSEKSHRKLRRFSRMAWMRLSDDQKKKVSVHFIAQALKKTFYNMPIAQRIKEFR